MRLRWASLHVGLRMVLGRVGRAPTRPRATGHDLRAVGPLGYSSLLRAFSLGFFSLWTSCGLNLSGFSQ